MHHVEISGYRAGSGAKPQHLLLTLLGDYWYRREESISSTALVDLLAEFDVSEPNARAAISRLARRGLLQSLRRGRATRYRLTSQAAATLEEGTRRIFEFGHSPRPWDGTWTCLSFSIPESQRSTRTNLRTRLRWLGFAALYDAVWFASGDRTAAAADLIAELGIESATIIAGPVHNAGEGDPLRAWDLDTLRSRYETFVGRFGPLREPAEHGRIAAAEALVVRTALIDEWRVFPALDPELPAELLPTAWPQKAAVDLFVTIYDSLGPPATEHVGAVLARHDPEAARLATHHTTRIAFPDPGGSG